jgi:hypothetical protein
MSKRRRNSEWWRCCNVLLLALLLTAPQQVLSATDPNEKGEPNLNSQMFPKKILPTGAKCDDGPLTANAVQLSDNIGLSPVLQHIKASIDTLNMRLVMLQQLAAEIQKMKRMLLESTMAVDGSKPIGDDSKSDLGKRISESDP